MNVLIRLGNPSSGPLHRMAIVSVIVALVLTACSNPGPAGTTQPGSAPSAPSAPGPASTGPKTLQLAFREDPPAIHGGSSGTPEREVGELLNAGLTTFDGAGNVVPKLATKVPSVAD